MRLAGAVVLFLLALFVCAAALARDPSVRREFAKANPCPYPQHDCIADHIVPLACGGADSLSNLQWQRKNDAKLKDKWERKLCIPQP